MVINVHASGFVLDRELREDVQDKLDRSLFRFEPQIGKVDAYLADLNGPKKGLDKSIRLVISIERRPAIVIEEKGEDWRALLESVSDRAVHTVSRQNERARPRRDRTSIQAEA